MHVVHTIRPSADVLRKIGHPETLGGDTQYLAHCLTDDQDIPSSVLTVGEERRSAGCQFPPAPLLHAGGKPK